MRTLAALTLLMNCASRSEAGSSHETFGVDDIGMDGFVTSAVPDLGNAPTPPVATPASPMVVRPECFGGTLLEGGTGRSTNSATPRSRPSTAYAPVPPAPPVAVSAPPSLEAPSAGGVSAGPTGLTGSYKAKEPADDALSQTVARRGDGKDGGGAEEKNVRAEMAAVGDADRNLSTPDAEDSRRYDHDWGASTYLSNDDSLSLASAQRLLYAVREGLSFSPDEVRPHELLNYFSFDTVDPRRGESFGVHGSAERTSKGVTLALSVEGAVPAEAPLDLTLLVDRSCSMEEEGRITYTRRGLERMVSELDTGDRVDLVLFDHQVCTPLENWVAGRDSERVLLDTIAKIVPRGNTDLNLGLGEAYRVARGKSDLDGRNRRMMLITDALLNTGTVDPNVVSDIGIGLDRDGIRLTGVGVGRNFNDQVLQKLTEKGHGAYVFLGSEAVVDRLFGVGFEGMVNGLAEDVQFALDLPDSLAIERFYGEESSTVAADVQPVHFQAGNTQLFLQDLIEVPGRSRAQDPITLTITYNEATSGRRRVQTYTTNMGQLLAADPHNVRKGLALMAFSDVLVNEAMGAPCDGAALATWSDRASTVDGDAELAFVGGLVERRCPGAVRPRPYVARTSAVPFKLKVDSDIAIGEVLLTCDGLTERVALSSSTTVALFDARPGLCQATLVGPVDLIASVEVPATGGETRCLVRGGRLHCSS